MKKEIKSEANHQSVGFHVPFLGDWLMIFAGGRVHGWLGILGGDGFQKKDMSFMIWGLFGRRLDCFVDCFGDVLFGMTKNLAASHTVAREIPKKWSTSKHLSRIGALKDVKFPQLSFYN